MSSNWLRWVLPVIILLVSYGIYTIIELSNADEDAKPLTIAKPTVEVESVDFDNHQVIITSYGEVSPLEETHLSSQVSGEVIDWHPNFVPGGVVKRGEVLVTIEKDNYEAAVLQAKADFVQAKASLIEEQAKAKVAQEQAKKLKNTAVTDLYLRKPQVLSARARVTSAQAALKRARRDLENCQVVSPYDALVISRQIGVGQYVSPATPIAVLNNIEVAEILIPIAGFDSAFIPRPLKTVKATITQKSPGNVIREGIIVRDLGVVDSDTRMVNLVVRVDNPYGVGSMNTALHFGSYVQVQFFGTKLSHVYKLPQELVNDRTVWIVNKNDQLEPREVSIVREEGLSFLISDGLKDQDRLVLTLPEYPQKGMQVIVTNSTRNESSETSGKQFDAVGKE